MHLDRHRVVLVARLAMNHDLDCAPVSKPGSLERLRGLCYIKVMSDHLLNPVNLSTADQLQGRRVAANNKLIIIIMQLVNKQHS